MAVADGAAPIRVIVADARPGGAGRWKHRRAPSFSPGNHAVVDHAAARVLGIDTVHMTDESGISLLQRLADGQEVEMLAWRIVWREGPSMLYHVSSLRDGARGWVRSEFLRPLQGKTPPPRPAPAPGRSAPRPEPRPARPAPSAGPAPRSTAPRVPTRTAPPPADVAREHRPVACTACGAEVHPQNLWKNASGKITGCDSCYGRHR